MVRDGLCVLSCASAFKDGDVLEVCETPHGPTIAKLTIKGEPDAKNNTLWLTGPVPVTVTAGMLLRKIDNDAGFYDSGDVGNFLGISRK